MGVTPCVLTVTFEHPHTTDHTPVPGWSSILHGSRMMQGCRLSLWLYSYWDCVGSHQMWDLIPEDSVSLEHPQEMRLHLARRYTGRADSEQTLISSPSFQRLTRCCNALIIVCGSSSTITQHTSSWGSGDVPDLHSRPVHIETWHMSGWLGME